MAARIHKACAQINGGTDTKEVPASKTKGQYAGNISITLILANRPRSDRELLNISSDFEHQLKKLYSKKFIVSDRENLYL